MALRLPPADPCGCLLPTSLISVKMAKNNKYKGNRPASKPAQTSTLTKPQASKADGECHVAVPAVKETPKSVTVALQPAVEVVQTPVVQTPPAESTVETWADAIADNSSYATADSDDPPTPTAVASTTGNLAGAMFEETPLSPPTTLEPALIPSAAAAPEAAAVEEPAASAAHADFVPEGTSAPAAPAVDTTAAPTASAQAAEAAVPTPPLAYDMADEAALVPKAAAAVPAVLAVSWRLLDLCLRAYTYPVSVPAATSAAAALGEVLQGPEWQNLLEWFCRLFGRIPS